MSYRYGHSYMPKIITWDMNKMKRLKLMDNENAVISKKGFVVDKYLLHVDSESLGYNKKANTKKLFIGELFKKLNSVKNYNIYEPEELRKSLRSFLDYSGVTYLSEPGFMKQFTVFVCDCNLSPCPHSEVIYNFLLTRGESFE